jgi:hypothetical protein
MKTYLRDEFATAQRIKELESLNAELLEALKALLSDYDYIARNKARTAIAKAEAE